jgi:hypothetical protein
VVLVNGGPERGKSSTDPVELWGWDGQTWSPLPVRTSEAPLWRNFGAVTYEVDHGVLVLYGGAQSRTRVFNDMWIWDGAAWTEVDADPGVPGAAGLVYDVARQQLVIFGGGTEQGGLIGDTWVWTGRWTKLEVPGPSERFPAAMAYDAAREQVFLYGGHAPYPDGSAVDSGDTWTWDGSTWTEHTPPGPTPGIRLTTRAAYDPHLNGILLVGGLTGGEGRDNPPLADTWLWDGAAWQQLPVNGPPARSFHTMAYDEARQRLVLFGGFDRPAYQGGRPRLDTWEWDGVTWTCVFACDDPYSFPTAPPAVTPTAVAPSGATVPAAQVPGPCNGHDLAYAPSLQLTLLVNCGPERPEAANDPLQLWGWDGAAWRLLDANGPPLRQLGGVAYDTRRDRLVLSGGRGPTADYTDMWAWSPAAGWQQLDAQAGSLSNHFAMVYDTGRDRLVAYGGQDLQEVVLGDTWEFDGAAWQRLARAGPPLRVHYAFAFDPIRGQTLLLGEGPDQLWAWRGGPAWQRQAAPGGPPARAGGRMAFHLATGRLVLMGGYVYGPNGHPIGDTWLWDGAAWTEYTGPTPTPRSHHALAYDPAREVLVLYGGYAGGATLLSDTWEWSGSTWSCRSDCPPP